MKKIFVFVLVLSIQSAHSQIREFQTTRLNSTAGAGVASILSTEAAVLNPATSTFFDTSSASYQRYSTSLRDKSDARVAAADEFAKRNESQGLFLSDNGGTVKGGVAYLTQKENGFQRQHYVFHAAAPLSEKTSLGLSYQNVNDKWPRTYGDRYRHHHRISAGMIHILDDSTVLGLVLTDPTHTTKDEDRLIAGFQYQVASRFTIIGDVGAQYSANFSKKYLWRAAVQLNVFSDFFIRAGKFYDNVQQFKGMGWGAAWMGPRFGVEFAQKFSEQFGRVSYIYEEETLVDTSLSVLIKF